MKKRVFISLGLFILFSFIRFVSADGGMVIYDPDSSIWKSLEESSQIAFINYENGIEKMILRVSMEEMSGTQAVWIFPVPAPVEQTHIDILEEIPLLNGIPLKESTLNSISASLILMSLTQIYTFPLVGFFMLSTLFLSADNTKEINSLEDNFYQDVKIYEYKEKAGITTQLITAKNPTSLSKYLETKNVTLPVELSSILTEYIEKEYCFVITWISNVEEFKKYNRYYPSSYSLYSLGIYVEFPTDEIYFPLKPTRMYKDKVIPINIYVLDYVTPKTYKEIEDKTQTEYYFKNYPYIPENLTNFFGESKHIIKYTKIKINSSSNNFIYDLFIKNEYPEKVKIQETIQKNILLYSICLFALLSCICSLISGLIFFRKQHPSIIKFFFFGLFNLLSFIGFSIASEIIKIDERFVKFKDKGNKASIKKVAIITLIVASTIAGMLCLLFLSSAIMLSFYSIISLLRILLSTALIFSITGVVLFLFLSPLIYAGYKNKKLLKFQIFFSVFFILSLIFSWIIISRLIL